MANPEFAEILVDRFEPKSREYEIRDIVATGFRESIGSSPWGRSGCAKGDAHDTVAGPDWRRG